jgi:hypothetical protein
LVCRGGIGGWLGAASNNDALPVVAHARLQVNRRRLWASEIYVLPYVILRMLGAHTFFILIMYFHLTQELSAHG